MNRSEIIDALKAADHSLGDARCMSVTDEIPDLYEDSEIVEDVLKRLEAGESIDP